MFSREKLDGFAVRMRYVTTCKSEKHRALSAYNITGPTKDLSHRKGPKITFWSTKKDVHLPFYANLTYAKELAISSWYY